MELSSPRRNTPVPLVVPFIFHPSSSTSSPRPRLSEIDSTAPRASFRDSPSLSSSLSFRIVSTTRVLHIKEPRHRREGREREGEEGKRTGYDECDQSVLKEERKRCVSKRNIGTDRERMEGGGGLKGEKRSLKSYEPLTFVIEFSPSAISVLSSPSSSPD